MSIASSDNLTPPAAAEKRIRIHARRRHTRRADSGNALLRYQAELRWCLTHAERLLGGPARPIVLDWDLQRTLQPLLIPEGAFGLGGAVYLFTSNAKLSDLDPAMRRPGRIDVVLQLEKPDARLRRRLVTRRWHPDILAAIDAESLVADTEGFSFAELEEARKLLVMHRAETGVWDWPAVRRLLRDPYRERAASRPIGFGPCLSSGNGTQVVATLEPVATSAVRRR